MNPFRSICTRFLSFALLSFCLPLIAQTTAPQPYKFSSSAQAVVDRLGSFQALPAETWLYRMGDIPHGERPDLNDSDWQPVKAPFDASRDAVWFRREITVPKSLNGYDLTGTRIWFHMNVSANGPVPEIVYFNGARVAMGSDLEDLVLFDNAQPGAKVLVAVKMLPTEDVKGFKGADLRVDFSANRPNPEDLRKELLSAAQLLPTITSNPTDLAQQEKTLESATDAVQISALDSGNQQAFDASLRAAQTQLTSLRPVLQQYLVHLTGNAHIDAAWLWPWTETVDVVRRTFGTALQLMEEYPGYTYTQSAAQYYEWMQQKYPDIFSGIQQRVKQGRWEVVGGMWVEPDLNLPDGESQVRQILVAKRYFKKNLGVDVRVGWNPDSFGYNWQLPQIYKKSGIDYFVTQKMAWNDTNQLPLKLFWWQSPDGSRVLTYFPHDYVNAIEPVKIATDLARAVQLNPGATEMMHLYGIGDHGGGPTRDMLDSGMHWMQPDVVFPKMEFGVSQTFFDEMARRVDTKDAPVWNYETLAAGNTALPKAPTGEISLPIWNDELYLEYHRGTYTTQAKHKWNLRHSTEWMLNAEKYSSLAWLGGLNYPSTPLNEAWKKVLFNQFHDLAAGSGISVIYKDAQKDYDVVHWTANDATHNALSDIDSHIDTQVAAGVPLLVWNTLSWKRTGVVEAAVQMPQAEARGVSVLDASGKVLPSQVLSVNNTNHTYHLLIQAQDVPSIGYVVLHVVPGTRPFASDLHVSGTTLENSLLRVVVDPKTGCITSLYDRQSHFESLAAGACGNMLQAFVDKPKDYDAWNINPNYDKFGTNLTMVDSVQVIEKGPLRSVIRITRHWSQSKFVQDITLYAGMPRVDVMHTVDWHETHILLKAAFSLAASSNMATYEIPYGSIQRPTTRNNSVEDAKFEVPAQRWADLGDGQHGFSLINDAKFGYDTKGNVMRLTLLRSPTWPDPNADRGEQHFSYALYPHAGTWREAHTVLRGFEFNYKLHALQVAPHTGELPAVHSFVSVSPTNLVMTAIKKSEDGNDLILRFYEWAGRKTNADIALPAGATSAVVTNLMETPDGTSLTVRNNHITVPVTPYSINTVRVTYGNRGGAFWSAQK
ncbi:MAG TPA: glycoside hydrolase family 38 C-terminal domain-containing protein [Acidobacteriaceae bacterium]|nr:glycoside hydrolase family 38 C-terminal domain-containing protein [Acidobacteriaceae bacterium]